MQILEKAAASAEYSFHGAELAFGIVVRTDLNGYSDWARDQDVSERAAVLDDFFSRTIPHLAKAGGVFFRDEGDCIISLFSDYFRAGATFNSAEAYCLRITSQEYGLPKLSAKSCIACGEIAIYQKAHETGSDDWSAEGDPFVRAARLEQALTSKRQVAYFADEYNAYFSATNFPMTGENPGRWLVKREKLQVPGLGAIGGWTDLVICEK